MIMKKVSILVSTIDSGGAEKQAVIACDSAFKAYGCESDWCFMAVTLNIKEM